MKFDAQKAFPYPVLRPGVDDYVDGEFQSNIFFDREDDTKLIATISVAISVPELISLIDNGDAEYVVVFTCRETYFRESVCFSEFEHKTHFDHGAFKGEVIIYSFILARKNINGYQCQDINPEFGEGPFIYKKGEVLALDEPKVLYFDRDLFKPVSSVFELCKDDNLQEFEWRLGFEEDKVQIKVSTSAKEKIDVARNTMRNKATLINSVYFSAIMEAISKLKEGSEYDDLRWASVIRRQCHNMSIDLEGLDSYVITQKLLNYPLGLLDLYLFRGNE